MSNKKCLVLALDVMEDLKNVQSYVDNNDFNCSYRVQP